MSGKARRNTHKVSRQRLRKTLRAKGFPEHEIERMVTEKGRAQAVQRKNEASTPAPAPRGQVLGPWLVQDGFAPQPVLVQRFRCIMPGLGAGGGT